MWLLALFLVLTLVFGWLYFFSRWSYRPWWLFYSLWFLALSAGQLQWSSQEAPWSGRYWLVIALAFLGLAVGVVGGQRLSGVIKNFQAKLVWQNQAIKIFVLLTLVSVVANLFIFWQIGTWPLLSNRPERLRFLVNQNIFGPLEYLAILGRITLPLLGLYWLTAKLSIKQHLGLAVLAVINFVTLALYVARINFLVAICLFIFSYLAWHGFSVKRQKLLVGMFSFIALLLVLLVGIPLFRQLATRAQLKPMAALSIESEAKLSIPAGLEVLAAPYLALVFNQQALNGAVKYYPAQQSYYWGKLFLANTFQPASRLVLGLEKISIQWKAIFLFWWNTATFWFVSYADFGLGGVVVWAIVFGVLLSLSYAWATRRPSLASVMVFGYANYLVIMSLYLNGFTRPEFYLELPLLLLGSWWLQSKESLKVVE